MAQTDQHFKKVIHVAEEPRAFGTPSYAQGEGMQAPPCAYGDPAYVQKNSQQNAYDQGIAQASAQHFGMSYSDEAAKYRRHMPYPGNMQSAYANQTAFRPPPYEGMPNAGQFNAATAARKRRKTRRVIVVVSIVCILLLLLAFALLMFLFTGPQEKSRQGAPGQLEGKSAEEIQAELARVVDEGMFNISIASFVSFPSGTDEGEIRIENVPGNRYLMQVVITRDDTREVIYTTDLIEPDHHIQFDALDVDLPAGTYACTAAFTAFDADTEEEVGTAAAKMVIQVES